MTAALINDQIRLAARPVGAVQPTDWQRTQTPVPDLADGQVLVQTQYLSLDPAMRGWMMANPDSYMPPVPVGEVMRALGVGQVLASRHAGLPVGAHVAGLLGVQTHAVVAGQGLNRVDPKLAPLPRYLGALGMPGLSAYFALRELGLPETGQTVVVSGAAGAVGSLLGQLAKRQGARVIGVAGGADKVRHVVDELGFDACIDYHHDDLPSTLRTLAPQGVDVFYDGVGGALLEAVLDHLALHARVVLVGAISQYNQAGDGQGPRNYMNLLFKRGTMKGFVVGDHYGRAGEAIAELAGALARGELRTREHVVTGGLDAFAGTFDLLFTGGNHGKLVLAL